MWLYLADWPKQLLTESILRKAAGDLRDRCTDDICMMIDFVDVQRASTE